MATERDKMLGGELYDPYDPALSANRRTARDLTFAFNQTRDADRAERHRLLSELLGTAGDGVWIEPPFHCDYGKHIRLGEKVFLNFGCVLLDCAEIRIGPRTLLAPNVQMYAATHPLSAKVRASGLESAKPITVGADVWIGGGAILLPGVTVGDRAVIGAGSVVTRDVPADSVVVGNPARVIKTVPED